MTVYTTAARLNRWLEDNSHRLAHKFHLERIGDWKLCGQQGIALDLDGGIVCGRITVWPEMLSDIEAINTKTSEILFRWSYMPFPTALLDEWLSGLEAHSGFNELPLPIVSRSGAA